MIVTAAEWQELKSGLISNTGIYRYGRARGGNLLLTPDASGDTLVLEYVSSYYAKSSGGTRKATYTADDDTSYFSEELLKLGLKYYLKSEYGLPTEEDALRYYDAMDSLIAQEKPAKIIRPSVRNNDFVINVPDTGVGL